MLDIPRRIQPRASQNLYKRAPPDGLRLPIFPQPLGGALKNRSAAPASPPCLGRRPRSAPLPFKSSDPHGTGVLLLDIPKFLGTAHEATATGCGSQHPLRALSGTRVLLAAAPTAPPCFRRRRRSSPLLPKGEPTHIPGLAPAGREPQLALPLGELSPQVTERVRPLTKSRDSETGRSFAYS